MSEKKNIKTLTKSCISNHLHESGTHLLHPNNLLFIHKMGNNSSNSQEKDLTNGTYDLCNNLSIRYNCFFLDELYAFSKLINMGFAESISMDAVKKYGKNINKSINYITSINSKQNNKQQTISNKQENDDNVKQFVYINFHYYLICNFYACTQYSARRRKK